MKPPVLDALSVPLDGACLVEASAGTGKTFNLARLFLRLLLEKDVPVESILTVTFTEAATAELRLRIRQKLAEAASFFAGGESEDELLRRLRGAADPETLLRRARCALRDFDLCSISTIHGFCDRMLRENAFESGQAFEQELVPDVGPLIEEVVRDFCALRLFGAEPGTIAEIAVHRSLPGLLELAREAVRRPDAVLLCEPEAPAPRPARGRGRASQAGAAEEDPSWRAILEFRRELVEYVRRELPRRKRARRVFSFDDMLLRLAQALEGDGGERLAEKIRQRYRAALIDEFQDTDPVQYRIFQRVFQRPGIPWFLVGDPKQSIYRFRGADVFAYLEAARDVPLRLDLDRNFRSDPSLVAATNLLFERLQRKAAPFVLEGIPFAPVRPRENARDRLRWADRPALPLVIEFLPASDEQGSRIISKDQARRMIPERLADEIAELLSGGAQIEDRPVSAGDVAVLTANNDQALEVQAALRQRGLPSVLVTERSVFESEEARALYRVLSAAANPQDAGGLRGALAGELVGLRAEDFVRFERDERAFEQWVEQAREWRRLWRERGVLSLVAALLDLRPFPEGPANAARLLALPGGERRLTNLRHLAELAHREEASRGLGPEGLLGWFERKMRDSSGGEEAELRLESDENAVRISTVHKAKGLEYPIVFCPYLWDAVKEPRNPAFLAYHDPACHGRPVLDIVAPLLSGAKKGCEGFARQQADREALAEGMRLMYVALTRARHQCRILFGRIGKSWHRSPPAYLLFRPELEREETMDQVKKWTDADLLRRLEALAASSGGKIAQEEFRPRPAPGAAKAEAAPPALSCRKFDRVLSGAPLTTSYSQMAAGDPRAGERDWDALAPEAPSRPAPEAAPAAGRVMLADFPAGTRTGYLFHSIFEKMDFADVDGPALSALVAEELPRHGFEPRQAAAVERAVRAVCRAALDPGDPSLRLAAIERQAVLRELPFVLPADLSRHGPAAARVLSRLLREHGDGAAAAYAARVEALSLPEVRGFLRGVMDLVFRHRGRWFVLDYKTNLLGAAPEAYRPAALAAAMDAHHYRLQCYLYAAALRRYLAYRLADFDYQRDFGGAYYLFVRGMDEANPPGAGVVFDRPPLALLEALDGFFAAGPAGEARP